MDNDFEIKSILFFRKWWMDKGGEHANQISVESTNIMLERTSAPSRASASGIAADVRSFLMDRTIEQCEVEVFFVEDLCFIHIHVLPHPNLRYSNLTEIQIIELIRSRHQIEVDYVMWRFRLDRGEKEDLVVAHSASEDTKWMPYDESSLSPPMPPPAVKPASDSANHDADFNRNFCLAGTLDSIVLKEVDFADVASLISAKRANQHA